MWDRTKTQINSWMGINQLFQCIFQYINRIQCIKSLKHFLSLTLVTLPLLFGLSWSLFMGHTNPSTHSFSTFSLSMLLDFLCVNSSHPNTLIYRRFKLLLLLYYWLFARAWSGLKANLEWGPNFSFFFFVSNKIFFLVISLPLGY